MKAVTVKSTGKAKTETGWVKAKPFLWSLRPGQR